MHETTQRTLCRIALVAGIVIPTVLVVNWCIRLNSSAHRERIEEQFRSELGLHAKIANMRRPRGGVTVFEGVELRDVESGNLLLTCGSLRAEQRDDSLVLSATEAVIQRSDVSRLLAALERRLQTHSAQSRPIRVMLGEVRLDSKGEILTLQQIRGEIASSQSGPQATVGFSLTGTDETTGATFRVTRQRSATRPTTIVQLHTGATPLPCSLLTADGNAARTLGAACTFRGMLTVKNEQTHFAGELIEVDLSRLTQHGFPPHRLSGTARMVIESVKLQSGRLDHLGGTVQASSGMIGRELLLAPVRALKMPAGFRVAPPEDEVPYKELALRMTLDAQGLSIWGDCAGSSPGAVLIDDHGPLLWSPCQQPQSASVVLDMLRGDGDESDLPPSSLLEIAKWLPLRPWSGVVPTDSRSPRVGQRPTHRK